MLLSLVLITIHLIPSVFKVLVVMQSIKVKKLHRVTISNRLCRASWCAVKKKNCKQLIKLILLGIPIYKV